MERTSLIRRIRALALVTAAAPLFAACQDSLSNQTAGTRPDPAGGALFRTYAAIGTSLSAGIQSGGINDSTQREAFPAQLAWAMGLTPGADWYYPSLRYPGCPAPYTNILTGARVGGASATACAVRDPKSPREFMSNVGIPSLRAEQAVNLQAVPFPSTDTLKLAQLITGGENPVDMVVRQNPTFVTIEVGANDVLGAATRGDTTLLTSTAAFQAAITAIADAVDGTDASVAIATIPGVTSSPFFTEAAVLFCLNTGLCPGVPATLPYSLPTFTIDASCAPNAPAVGSSYILSFNAVATMTNVLAGGGAANLNCATDVATVTTGAGTAPAGPTLNAAEYAAVAARTTALNSAITTLAAARGYAVAKLDSALASAPVQAQIPPIPVFSNPSMLMGPLFSLDGLHPSKAGARIMATVFANAINAAYGTSITVP